jgi:hypothetical protein
MLYLIKGLNKNYTNDCNINYIYNNFQFSFCSYAFTNRKCVKIKNELVQVVRVLAPFLTQVVSSLTLVTYMNGKNSVSIWEFTMGIPKVFRQRFVSCANSIKKIVAYIPYKRKLLANSYKLIKLIYCKNIET